MAATIQLTLGYPTSRGSPGGVLPILLSKLIASETLTSAPTAAASTLTATPEHVQNGAVWTVVVTGAKIFGAFGQVADVNDASKRRLILDNWILDFAVTEAGEKFAFKDA